MREREWKGILTKRGERKDRMWRERVKMDKGFEEKARKKEIQREASGNERGKHSREIKEGKDEKERVTNRER